MTIREEHARVNRIVIIMVVVTQIYSKNFTPKKFNFTV